MQLLNDDVEIGIQPRHCHGMAKLKKYFCITSAWLCPAAGAFVSELIIFNALQKTADLFDTTSDELPIHLYLVAAGTSSLIGCLLGPRVYRILRRDP